MLLFLFFLSVRCRLELGCVFHTLFSLTIDISFNFTINTRSKRQKLNRKMKRTSEVLCVMCFLHAKLYMTWTNEENDVNSRAHNTNYIRYSGLILYLQANLHILIKLILYSFMNSLDLHRNILSGQSHHFLLTLLIEFRSASNRNIGFSLLLIIFWLTVVRDFGMKLNRKKKKKEERMLWLWFNSIGNIR